MLAPMPAAPVRRPSRRRSCWCSYAQRRRVLASEGRVALGSSRGSIVPLNDSIQGYVMAGSFAGVMLHTPGKIAGVALRRVHERHRHAMRGAPEQPPECNAQRVGRAQGVNNSARPRAGAAGARGSLDPNRRSGSRAALHSGRRPACWGLPTRVWVAYPRRARRAGWLACKF